MRGVAEGDGGVDAVVEFVVYGVVDGEPCSAYWVDGWLSADAEVVARAEIVVALGEQSPGPWPVRASLEHDPLAALFTITRAFSSVDHVHLCRGAARDDVDEAAEAERWLALLSADPLDLPRVVVSAPEFLDSTTSPLLAAELEAIQVNADVVLDVSRVVACSSAAVEVLDATGRRFVAAGGSFRLRRPSATLWRLLHIFGMVDWFTIETAPDRGLPEA
jgi:anti-anti-sigma regulatory factor